MIFSSGLFVFFFALVFLVQWYLIGRIRNVELRKQTLHIFLLIVSYVFYMTWDWRFGFLILFSTVIDYVAGLYIQRQHDTESEAAQKKARLALIISLGVNLGSLGIFKYFHFFAESFIALFAAIDPTFAAQDHNLLFRVILPVGISFFTFQSMSYTIDVYRRIIPAEKSLIRFALFVSFFPQLVAGPIVTAREFLPQLERFPSVDSNDLREGCQIFLLGFIKKSVLADRVAPFVDMVHSDPLSYGFFNHWLAVIAFTMQLYLDFSGYSDMAIGSARLLGFYLPENFRMPYLSHSITEHWQRWHISLSRWFRDYVYIPLGGNRVGPIRHKWNLFSVMAISGLWHGAAWTYVLWGTMHGIAMVYEAIGKQFLPKKTADHASRASMGHRVLRFGSWLYQILFVMIFNTILFRIEDISNTIPLLKRLLGLEGSLAMDIRPANYKLVFAVLAAMVIGHILGQKYFHDERLRSPLPQWAEKLALPLTLVLLTQIAVLDQTTFIYFAF